VKFNVPNKFAKLGRTQFNYERDHKVLKEIRNSFRTPTTSKGYPVKGRIGGSEAIVLGLSRQAKVSSQTLAKELNNWDLRP